MLVASESASSEESTGRSAIIIDPPPRAEPTSPRSMPMSASGVPADWRDSITSFEAGSHERTTTSSTCWTPVTRGRNVHRSSPQRSVGGSSPSSLPAFWKLSAPPSTPTSKSILRASRHRNSQSVSLFCCTKSCTSPALSIVPASRPARSATFAAMSSELMFW